MQYDLHKKRDANIPEEFIDLLRYLANSMQDLGMCFARENKIFCFKK